jgi:hypothetical protein
MHHDGSYGARARSARIRAAHEYEATELDSMRRNAAKGAMREPRASVLTRLSAALGRARWWHADPPLALESDGDGEVAVRANVNINVHD